MAIRNSQWQLLIGIRASPNVLGMLLVICIYVYNIRRITGHNGSQRSEEITSRKAD